MEQDTKPKHWLQTLPGLLSATAGLIGAITAFVVAFGGKGSVPSDDGCISPFVYRLAVPSDHVCVTEESQKQVELENKLAPTRRHLGSYGPDTCIDGYVWREAFEGDVACVLPERREAVKIENASASQRTQR